MSKITQTELKKKIYDLKEEIEDIRNFRKHIRGYREMEEKLQNLRNEYFESIRDQVTALESDIRVYERQIKEAQQARALELPDNVRRWFSVYAKSMDFGYGGLKIVWVSENGRWIIITNKGGTAGTGTAMGTNAYYYAPVRHYLCDTYCDPSLNGRVHLKSMGDNDIHNYTSNRFGEFTGKLTKEAKQKLIDMIPNLENDIIVREIWKPVEIRKRNPFPGKSKSL